jgi:hypothetical protein
MKKILLVFALLVSAITTKALTATIYVKADKAPYLYAWYTTDNKEHKLNGVWPGSIMTETTTKTNLAGEEITFWYKTFEIESTSFNIIFNNGNTNLMQQTGNISNISSDRYFTYNGKTQYTDITEEFGVEIPDVEIQSVALLSELNGWDGMAQVFTEVVKNQKYTYNLDLSASTVPEDFYRFKFMVNSSAYLGWSTEGLTRVDPNEWIIRDDAFIADDNFGIDLDETDGVKAFLFTMEFAGGKDIFMGWTLTIAEGTPASIQDITLDAAANQQVYNLSGQRVGSAFKGIAVTKGKKIIVK